MSITPFDQRVIASLAMGMELTAVAARHKISIDVLEGMLKKPSVQKKLAEARDEIEDSGLAFDRKVGSLVDAALEVLSGSMSSEDEKVRIDAAKLILQMGGKLNKAKESGGAVGGPSLVILTGGANRPVEKLVTGKDKARVELPMTLTREVENE